MKVFLSAIATLTATAAAAHPGHVAPEAGHTHGEVIALVVVAAICVTVLIRAASRR